MKRLPTLTALMLVLVPVAALALAPPLPLAPPNGTKGPNSKPVLTVDGPGNVVELNFRVYQEDGVGLRLVAEIYTAETAWPVPEGSLVSTMFPSNALPVGDYWWTCRVRDHFGWSEFFAPVWSFSVETTGPDGYAPGIPPEPPALVAPPTGTKSGGLPIVLSIGAPAGLELFHFVVRRTGDDDPVWEGHSTAPNWELPLMLPVEPDIYYWSARVFDGTAWSAFAEPWWSFEIGKPVGGEQTGDVRSPAVWALPQVFPNPTRPGSPTLVRLALDRPARLSAAVYDAAGKRIKTLAAGRACTAGQCEFVWDGTDETGGMVGAGTYLCRITHDDAAEPSVRVAKFVRSGNPTGASR